MRTSMLTVLVLLSAACTPTKGSEGVEDTGAPLDPADTGAAEEGGAEWTVTEQGNSIADVLGEELRSDHDIRLRDVQLDCTDDVWSFAIDTNGSNEEKPADGVIVFAWDLATNDFSGGWYGEEVGQDLWSAQVAGVTDCDDPGSVSFIVVPTYLGVIGSPEGVGALGRVSGYSLSSTGSLPDEVMYQVEVQTSATAASSGTWLQSPILGADSAKTAFLTPAWGSGSVDTVWSAEVPYEGYANDADLNPVLGVLLLKDGRAVGTVTF